MTWAFRLFGLFLAASAGGADFAFSETSNFDNPTIRGQRLDFCRHFGSACGKPAADLFCMENGFAGAQRFVIDQNIGARGINTLVFGDGRLCQGANCSGFRTITCVRPDKQSAPPAIMVVPIKPVVPPPPAVMVIPVQPPSLPPQTMTVPVQPPSPPPPVLAVPVQPPPPPALTRPLVPTLPAPTLVRPAVPLPPIRPNPQGGKPANPSFSSAATPSATGPINPVFIYPSGASLVRCLGSGCEFAVTFDFDIDPQADFQSEYFVGNVEKILGAGGFRWQVSSQPFPDFGSGDDLNPPGLLASGDEAGPSRGFSIDFKNIVSTSLGRSLPIEKLHIRIVPIAKPDKSVIVG